jgi:hypothetical protein
MGEHVRRRLAAAPQSSDMMENSMTMTSSPSSDSMMQRFVKKKQQQRSSNLGYRLQTGMNLQVRGVAKKNEDIWSREWNKSVVVGTLMGAILRIDCND